MADEVNFSEGEGGDMSTEEINRLRNKYIGSACEIFFRDTPLRIELGDGVYLFDEKGKRYLDCINNVCHVGHCNERVVKAIWEQAARLNTNNRYLHPNIVRLAKRLVDTMPEKLNRVYLVNSGSEANDLALRLARAHTGNEDIITLDHAYHGHLTSTIAVSPYKSRKLGEASQSPLVHEAPCPDTYRGKYTVSDAPDGSPEKLGELYADEVRQIVERLQVEGRRPAAFIAESLQSCGGQIIPPPGYLQRVYRTVRGAGGVCIADEVQVGFGRAGTAWWAFQTQGVEPDIVTVGKPMGNGHPVAAVICTEEVNESFAKSGVAYFNTFGGNPVSCAAAMAVMDEIEDKKLMENCVQIGELINVELLKLKEKHSLIGDVRVLGMFAGLELVKDREMRQPAAETARLLRDRMREEGVLLSVDGPDNNVIKFKPPIIFNEDNVEELISKLDKVLTELENFPRVMARL